MADEGKATIDNLNSDSPKKSTIKLEAPKSEALEVNAKATFHVKKSHGEQSGKPVSDGSSEPASVDYPENPTTPEIDQEDSGKPADEGAAEQINQDQNTDKPKDESEPEQNNQNRNPEKPKEEPDKPKGDDEVEETNEERPKDEGGESETETEGEKPEGEEGPETEGGSESGAEASGEAGAEAGGEAAAEAGAEVAAEAGAEVAAEGAAMAAGEVAGGAAVATSEIWIPIVLIIIAIIAIVIVIAIAFMGTSTGTVDATGANPVTQHETVLTLLARENNPAARLKLFQNADPTFISELQAQADAEKDPAKQKIVIDLVAALKLMKPNVNYSTLAQPSNSDQSTWTEDQKERQRLLDADAAYKKIAPTLTAFSAVLALETWVNTQAAKPKGQNYANQAYTPGGGDNCWNTVSYALSTVFPNSNPKGAVGGGMAASFSNAPGAGIGEGPFSADYITAQQALNKGQLPVWHIRGDGSGQHWIVVLSVDAASNTVREYDPAYGRVVTLNPGTEFSAIGPGWKSRKFAGSNYLGYSDIPDNGKLYHGYPFTPPGVNP